jgi:hypothetical protein
VIVPDCFLSYLSSNIETEWNRSFFRGLRFHSNVVQLGRVPSLLKKLTVHLLGYYLLDNHSGTWRDLFVIYSVLVLWGTAE